VGTSRWRAVFDAVFEGKEPVNLRCSLQLDGKPLTETWMYQYFP
jgi:glucans biosynthesis protein